MSDTTKDEPASERPGLRITRVYTKTGDAGTTRLVGGQTVPKHDPRIEAYGTVDELSVTLGQAREHLAQSRLVGMKFLLLARHLQYIQNLLFTVGGDLATRVEDRWPGMPLTGAEETTYLENLIDAYNDTLPPLKDFILPGGGPLALSLHEARVVCRTAERRTTELAGHEDVGPHVIPFLNRLSDLLFVLARWAVYAVSASDQQAVEPIWNRNLAQPPIPSGEEEV